MMRSADHPTETIVFSLTESTRRRRLAAIFLPSSLHVAKTIAKQRGTSFYLSKDTFNSFPISMINRAIGDLLAGRDDCTAVAVVVLVNCWIVAL